MTKLFLVTAILLFSACNPPRVVTVDSKQHPLDVEPPPLRQTAQVFEKTNYLLYLPEGYGTEEKRWPLILYLHGKSLRGNDLEKLKSYGLAALLEKDLSIPFVVVSPQCSADSYWIDEDEMLMRLSDEVSSKYAIDSQRVYVSGHSMGARGTWYLASRHPQKFAAIIPIADGPQDLSLAHRLKNVPIWTFHGTKDDLAPFQRTEQFVEALKRAGAEVKFTPLPDRDHFILDIYENKQIYDWLLQHKRT